jgi:hypothetical protein
VHRVAHVAGQNGEHIVTERGWPGCSHLAENVQATLRVKPARSLGWAVR